MAKSDKHCSDQCAPSTKCYHEGCPWFDNVEFEPQTLEEAVKDDPNATQELVDEINRLFRINAAKGYGDREMHEQTGKHFLCGIQISEEAAHAFENFSKYGPNYPGSPWFGVTMFKDDD